eukprot:NODE_697_length_2824_cov_2.642937.p1 GENE.NODE_697_length_2824_cov_2.642937~~NODE_697_length_2824_cov_2.642937.p1  ORF type:complete len:546 (-),score=201.07 NODE_697_length_2824_cov_2.642937:416-2053(-)
MLQAALERGEGWRRASGLSAEGVKACGDLCKYWRGHALAGFDHDGAPVLWERPGLLDWQGFAALAVDQVVCCELLSMEHLARRLDEITVEEQRLAHQLTVIVDLEGLPISFASPACLQLLRQVARLNSELYPEILKNMLLVRPPNKFAGVWKVAETYFEPRTRAKIHLVPVEGTAEALRKHVPWRHVPRYLGGPRRAPSAVARKIPGRLLRYLSEHGPQPPPGIGDDALASAPHEAPAQYSASTLFARYSRTLLRGKDDTDFSVKEAAFPRSSWEGSGTLPPPHTWGCLSAAAASPLLRAPPPPALQRHMRSPHHRTGGALAALEPPAAAAAVCGDGAPPAPAALELLDVDVFRYGEDGPVVRAYDHPTLAPQHFRRKGDDRFFLVINWITGEHQMVVLAAFPASADAAEGGDSRRSSGSTDAQVWQRFLAQPPALRWRRLRVSCKLFEASWVVQQLVQPNQSSVLAKLLPMPHQGDRHLEVTVRLTKSAMRRLVVVFRHSHHLIVNGLTYSLATDVPGEPYERLLFAHYCAFVDVARLRLVQPL